MVAARFPGAGIFLVGLWHGGLGVIDDARARSVAGTAGALALAIILRPGPVQAAAEVKLDREFLGGLIEKLPPAPFAKEGQYRGSVRGFRLAGIDPKTRRLLVACEVAGEFRPPIAGAIRRAVTPPGSSAIKPQPVRPKPLPPKPGDSGWKAFTFDVRAAVRAEPGSDGAPRFWVDIEEVKRREIEGAAGVLAKVLGRHFDQLVTQIADGKAALLNAKLNAQVLKKVAAFKEFGVLREVDYAPDQLVLHFDVTRFKSEGIACYVFGEAKPGTVPLYRWFRPHVGDRIYTTSPQALGGHPYFLFEGIACHVFGTPQPGTVPLQQWRRAGDTFYTTNTADGINLARNGYRPELVACHVFPGPQPGAVPLYRFVDSRIGVHFYSTHPHAEFLK
jgi:hypothetical protein